MTYDRVIYDCFPFFNEYELLEIRLHEMDPITHKFIIVEGTHTFSGKPKEEFLNLDDPRIKPFADKWERNFGQKQHLITMLMSQCRSEKDILVMSDLDEIPCAKAVAEAEPRPLLAMHQKFAYYYLNYQAFNIDGTPKIWPDAKICTWGYLKYTNFKNLRLMRYRRGIPCGWHFSFMGGVDRIQTKINAYTHQELNTPEFNNKESIESHIDKGEDLFNRPDRIMKVVSLDDSFPKYLRENQEKFKHMLR